MKNLFIIMSFGFWLSACGDSVYRADGVPGEAGKNGTDGAGCKVETQPFGALVSCGCVQQIGGEVCSSKVFVPNGQPGQPGQQGPVGITGDTGPKGDQGEQGIPGVVGTQIDPVQLCPSSFVPSYPNSFPEVALCIDGTLYGVYSTNGGFLAELTPGSYSSNGINVSCTFTVVNGCVVQ